MLWRLRYLKNGLVASIPAYRRLRLLKRRLIQYDPAIDEVTLEQGCEMVEMLTSCNVAVKGSVVLELGSGWKPIIPLVFVAAGARTVVLTDAEQLLDSRLLQATAKQLAERADHLASRLNVRANLIKARLAGPFPRELDGVCNRLGLKYLAPIDTRQLPFGRGELDIIVSRAVLEHIPHDFLRGIFLESARVLVPGRGYLCHIIDNSDHRAHGDRRVSMLSFLRYSERAWRWFALNPLDFTNRLRHSDYVRMIGAAGFRLVRDDSVPDPSALDILRSMPVAEPFRLKDERDLAILTSRFVALRTDVDGEVRASPRANQACEAA